MTKLSPDGSALDYSTYLGGFNTSGFFDLGSGIAVDSTGAAYVAGEADSTNFPVTPGAFDTTQNGSVDAFVTKLNPGGLGARLLDLHRRHVLRLGHRARGGRIR